MIYMIGYGLRTKLRAQENHCLFEILCIMPLGTLCEYMKMDMIPFTGCKLSV